MPIGSSLLMMVWFRSSSVLSAASEPEAEGLSVIKVRSEEAALVLGRGGSTKRKLENAADCDIELVNTGRL